jgi:hypothetical protein
LYALTGKLNGLNEDSLGVTGVEGFKICGAEMVNTGAEYPLSKTGKILLDASTIILTRQLSIDPEGIQAIRVVKQYCAMGS